MSAILSNHCSCLQRLFPFMLAYQSIVNRDYSPAASPNSYFTGLPLLIQPTELCIIHPQHVVAMKCRNTFSNIINNSCSEKGEWNAKWKAKQLNQLSDPVGLSWLMRQFAALYDPVVCYEKWRFDGVIDMILTWDDYRGKNSWLSCGSKLQIFFENCNSVGTLMRNFTINLK